ncbi:MAG: hypothetical protein PHN78_07120, partial [Dehalococcoidales bacterium]|nr:hypothetical protein [Dehalococcoidales bacterium]
MLYWMQLLHFYQPPTQSHEVLARICDECYRPILQVFKEHPHARVTVNICGVLTEMLSEHGHGDIIEILKELAENGQIEFTGTGKYHPILPLIPEDEVQRQIMENARTNRLFLGESFAPQGLFPPEMCYSPDVVEPILNSGYKWIILSGVACPVDWPMDVVHEISFRVKRLAVLFRDDILSNRISFKSITSSELLAHLRQLSMRQGDVYIITAMDAETFGHHIKNWEREFLANVYEGIEPEERVGETPGLETVHAKMVLPNELLRIFSRGRIIQPPSSSWSTSKEDIMADNPYPLWRGKGNEIHKLQWEHLNICLDMTSKALILADSY